jgi:FAD:protein FMN transferase
MMRRAQPLLGTIVEVTAEGAGDASSAAIEAAFASIVKVQWLMSFHDPSSDVSRINGAAAGEAVSIDPHTSRVLCSARALSELSDGAFDVTTASVLVENAFLPGRSEQPLPDVTYRDLDLLPGDRVCWRRKGWIDLGGIAKGYAVDCAVAVLRANGVATGVVNAGGDLRCFGAAQAVHVRHPYAPMTLVQMGWLTDAAFATSAGYFSGIDRGGGQIDPLVDPRRRRCVNWEVSTSVAAPDCMTADALTKIIRLRSDLAPEILVRSCAQALVIDDQGVRCCGGPLLQADPRAKRNIFAGTHRPCG